MLDRIDPMVCVSASLLSHAYNTAIFSRCQGKKTDSSYTVGLLLERELIEMGALCEDAISASMHTLKNEADKKTRSRRTEIRPNASGLDS